MKGRWYLWSTRQGILVWPEPVRRLPFGALKSADGRWAESSDKGGVAAVYLRLNTSRW